VADVRSSLIAHLARSLGGDALAAEYVLLHVLASVTLRQEPNVVGKLTLNLQGFPEAPAPAGAGAGAASGALVASAVSVGGSGAGAGAASACAHAPASSPAFRVERLEVGASPAAGRVHAALASLLPREALLPLSVGKLNSIRLAPQKDAETDRMLAGVLQLPASTHLTVDATVLQPGQLETQGVLNLRELQGVIAEQAVTLRFPYHEQKLPVGASPTRS
jgi:hypothetical protein